MHMMLRIAAIAAGVVMAGATWAQADGIGWTSASSLDAAPGGTPSMWDNGYVTTARVLPGRCEPGWTLVYVDTVANGPSKKCAAVGDLRDPY